MIDLILPPALEKKIVDTIQCQCRIFQKDEKVMKSHIYELYENRREKYILTAYVLSGFAPVKFNMEGVKITDLKYGLNTCPLYQPELYTDTAVIQIYSSGAKAQDTQLVKERCQQYNSDDQMRPHFLLIQFTADKEGYLEKIDAIYPTDKGQKCQIAVAKTLYYQPKHTVIPFVG